MSKAETVARLERLLERVRARSRHAQTSEAATQAAAPVAEPVEEPVQLTTWTPPPPDDPLPEVPITTDVDYVESTLVAVTETHAEDPPGSGRYDSAERLVAAEGDGEPQPDLAPQLLPDLSDEVVPPPPDLDQEIEAIPRPGQSAIDAVGEEDAEHAPASSRRPVMPAPEERLDQMAFGAEDGRPPLHTPPPESGRVPAAPSDEFDGEALSAHDAPQDPQADEPMVARATRAALESSVTVADMAGAPSRPEPTTFSGILAETLSL